MVSLTSLLLPILLSAVAVFVVSSVIHMFLGYHATDYGGVPSEDEAMAALGRFDIPPGDYVMPHAGSMSAMNDPAYKEKWARGPVVFMTVFPKGQGMGMGKQLTTWFLYILVVTIFAAYVASRAVGDAAPEYLDVFRFVGTTAFVGYGVGHWPQTIWYGRKAATALKSTFDGLVYALVTAGIFGWLWPM